MKIETAYTAHPGGRDEQQDAVAVLERPDGGECLVVLADGMGGHAGGSLASRTVVETAERVWADDGAPGDPRGLLAHICQSAHEAINQAGEDQNLSPRSTCVLLHLRGGMAHWAHVGDSRLYRFRDGAQLGRTRDHSVVQMLLDMGKISEEEMGTHPDQNRLTQSLGGDTDPEPDFGSDEA
ncbi:MAG: protein phosphatase 2C domain-containing protein, partial [Bauldia litoralis]